MANHELFGEVLAAFESSSGFRRADYAYFRHFLVEIVPDTGYQRILVTDHDHAYSVITDELFYSRKVEWREGYVFAPLRSAAIAWCDIQFSGCRAL